MWWLISTGACERLSGHPVSSVPGWVARVEYPVPKHDTYQAVQPGFRKIVLMALHRKKRET